MVNAKDWIRRASKLTKTMEAAAKEFVALSNDYSDARDDAAANNALKAVGLGNGAAPNARPVNAARQNQVPFSQV
jgi:hypothetical protein